MNTDNRYSYRETVAEGLLIKLRIYFSAARQNRVIMPVRRLARLSRRGWLVQYDLLLCWLIRTLSRSHRAHICIGIDGGVIDPQIRGNVYWPELAFVAEYPSLLEYIEIETDRPADETIVQPRERRSAWPTFIRWVTRGRTQADDCLTVAIRLIRSAGVDIDQRTRTPQKLYDQLIQLPGARLVTIADA